MVIYTPDAARLVRQHRFDGGPFVIAEFVAHDFEAPVHVHGCTINRQWLVVELLVLRNCFRLGA